MVEKHYREIEQREPYAVSHGSGVTIIKGAGGFTGASFNHDLFDTEWLAFWINFGLDAESEIPRSRLRLVKS